VTTESGSKVRVCLQATGHYSLDLALALQDARGIGVAVLNPKLGNRFAATLCRSKTDPADAQVLAEYARRMPFQLWQPPHAAALELRTIIRHIAALTQQHTRESNRLHAASASTAGGAVCGRISNVLCVISITAWRSCARKLGPWCNRTRSCNHAWRCC
jgi:transposase